MNKIKNDFSIKDLENLSGIKAHTIRIWEKRYNLLHPKRTDTNIRHYSLASLQKLLNIAYLNNNGIKISKIAKLKENEIPVTVREIASRGKVENHAINALKLAMLNFDQVLFYKTYNGLIQEKSFRSIFYDVFLPLLNEIGLLWQTDTITPAHEHFLTVHMKQKILINIEKLQNLEPKPISKTFVLYLPENEIHDIGLLFINYELRSRGFHTIFLGESVPIENLPDVLEVFDEVTFISYFTVRPIENDIEEYFKMLEENVLSKRKTDFWVLGKRLAEIDISSLPKKIKTFNSIEELVKNL
ncbi:MAG: MerR family transcriptional regulator [Flavobacteriaceae bacterium]|nr:MerR family transcriptional regulator [Flavobacteriaceae bacterium]